VTDQEFALRGIVWLGAAWAAGIWAWLWDARRKRVVSSRRSAPHEKSTAPAAPAAAIRGTGSGNDEVTPGCGSDLLVLTKHFPIGGERVDTITHPVDATTGPGAGAMVGARPAFGGRP